ncbi:hypothetical protein [Pengzhenrongella frigida]|uniref:hypothetical protein n=1 Tax=Pengzhenrongella frigida TaxID=1259133 RepID=UPI0013EBCA8F|nr:hypothetical protein [Cellulomonas sp. HLT2-17]
MLNTSGTTPSHARSSVEGVDGRHVDLDGRRFYRITGYEQMPPFFMTVVSASDVWLFISSTGGLTAGRRDAGRALFPYYTDDKVTESAGRTGGLSVLRVARPDGTTTVWQPFAELRPGDQPTQRTLYKDVLGTTLVFEEVRPDLSLRLRVTWQASGEFGVVRTCELTSSADRPCAVDLLDGFVNLLPAGVGVQIQNEFSNLLDAYKRCEVDRTGLAMVWLNSSLTDLAEPSESLRANVAWQVGLPGAVHLLSTRQVPAFGRGEPVTAETDVRGARGAYLVRSRLTLAAGSSVRWRVVADVDQDAADVIALRARLLRPEALAADLTADLAGTRADLEQILAATDAPQRGADELATAHHLANVLFNTMRGGLPAHGYTVDSHDVRAFIAQRSRPTARRCADVLDALPAQLRADELVAIARAHGDDDLVRLATEYLPLTFSRRHGDPSRPWNTFQIALQDSHGDPLLEYQGNWRDIFQNWEALAWSFPEYVESMVTVFLDATTADGYNPYRISRAGIGWEVPEPGNPWANIGYWSDHQIIYVLKLLETSHRFHPGRLEAQVNEARFTHADVPYRIATYDAIVRDPYETIAFDVAHAAVIDARVDAEGGDGRLVHDADGGLVRVTLGEKLLLLLLAKLVNLVPDGGIWMNTQRPEWNDANNALVGKGLSVVTLAYVGRYLHTLRELLTVDVEVTAELRDLITAVHDALGTHAASLTGGFDDAHRRAAMDDLGEAGSAYRQRVYGGFSGERTTVGAGEIADLLDLAHRYVESGVRANRRADALYHSYNVLTLTGDAARIQRLDPMLEGQVAVLSSGLLDPAEAVVVLRSLRSSALYRADQDSYTLYPDKVLPGFLARNRFVSAQAVTCPLVGLLVDAGDRSVVVRDVDGDFHFAAQIHNARDIDRALDLLAADPDNRAPDTCAAVARDRARLQEIFEGVFLHAQFTGRSGSFFAYEGLGSIYWHMVSKVLLTVQETLERAVAEKADAATIDALAASYEEVRAGLGYCKTPEVYGAFPTDPYSHTPGGHGARQPGMTGQVKEEILTRLGELGLRVDDGRIVIRPVLLRDAEWTVEPGSFDYTDLAGAQRSIDLPVGSIAFTFCQVPVVYHRGDRLEVVAHLADGTRVSGIDAGLDAGLSAGIFRRDGQVTALTVHVPPRAPASAG